MQTIDHNWIEVALERCDGNSFEKFSQAFFSSVFGLGFMPLGGTHDGGADGFLGSGTFATPNERFLQASIQADHSAKIRQTVKRLREFGRSPRELLYATSRVVPTIDMEESNLSVELGVSIRIRDRKYFINHVNDSAPLIQSYDSYLSPHTYFLQRVGGASLISQTPELPARTLCVFLGQEIERRRGHTDLLEAVTDSLILWALEATDPDKKILMNRADILTKIEAVLPSAKHFVRGVFDHRLEALASKNNTDGREVRWHRKQDLFCLPFETRQIVAQENGEDEALKARVSAVFEARAVSLLGTIDDPSVVPGIVELCHRALMLTFEKQGLEVAYFLTGDEPEQPIQTTIYENIEQSAKLLAANGHNFEPLKEIALQVLRGTFYGSSADERTYLSKLSRTYTLLFTLRNEPRIVEYFRSMSGNFVLYIGADLIIRSLSEHFLGQQDRMMLNLFRILAAAGSALILTEVALEEVHTHIRASDLEYRNHYAEIDHLIDPLFARHIDRILIRSYFYAKKDPTLGNRRPTSWGSFLGQFSSYSELHEGKGRESLKRYLCEEFGFTFESKQETAKGVDLDAVAVLADSIANIRQHKEKKSLLAFNDAMHIHRVYAKREEIGEGRKPNPYGYRTWWLTQETQVRRVTGSLVAKQGAQYIIRPEFLLNFISLSPSAEEVRRSYDSIFPSILGVRLSNRMREDVFEKVVDSVRDAQKISDARARSLLSELADRLKADRFKRYEKELLPMDKMYR